MFTPFRLFGDRVAPVRSFFECAAVDAVVRSRGFGVVETRRMRRATLGQLGYSPVPAENALRFGRKLQLRLHRALPSGDRRPHLRGERRIGWGLAQDECETVAPGLGGLRFRGQPPSRWRFDEEVAPHA